MLQLHAGSWRRTWCPRALLARPSTWLIPPTPVRKCPMHSVGSAPLFTYLPTPTAQGTLLALVGEIFGIKTSFLGKIASNMARVSLSWPGLSS